MFAFFGPCSSSMLQSPIKPCIAFIELIVRIDPGMFSGCQGHLHWRHWLHKQMRCFHLVVPDVAVRPGAIRSSGRLQTARGHPLACCKCVRARAGALRLVLHVQNLHVPSKTQQ